MKRAAPSALFLVVSLLVISTSPARLQQQPATPADRFEVSDVMIPARDGKRLHTKIFTPRDQAGLLPIIFKRTPYGIEGSDGNFNAYYKALADEGYIFVFQDIRGKFGSEGDFVMQRPARPPSPKGFGGLGSDDPNKAIDEGTDTYDSIEWLIKNVRSNNGRVGMLGVSYDGWTTIMAAIEPHPALKAISPQASPADMWMGDDFHHNGAFRLSYGFEYATMMESGKDVQDFKFDRYDTFDWYLSLGPLANVNAKYLHGKIPTWNDYVAHPDYDEFWKRQTMIPHLNSVKVPTLNVAGWWDQEDFYGPIRIYDALERFDTQGINYLVVGPWRHGGWSGGTGDSLGAIPFGGNTAEYFRDQVQAPFFAYFLKDKGARDFPQALTFESGANEWRRWDQWPPTARAEVRSLIFGANETLTLGPPEAGPEPRPPIPDPRFDEFVSDPAHPVPYRQRPIQPTYFPGGSRWSTWLVEDQRFVDDRADVLSWETSVLNQDVTIAGEVKAHIFASTTGSDADWIVKLIDVYPEDHPTNWNLAGFQLMVSNEVFRGRYRTSFEKPAPITPNAVLEYTWSLHTQNYTFKKGHRIMVQVQSTWFPIIDRNPQTFVSNIFEAKDSDFKAATHRVYRTPQYPSRVDVPVVLGR
ncbi:MAG: X-Pro dipeptidyl-peptidase [Acidobacterium sp.]|nr:CocE/NonD family hydrolase [Acidobacteriota bacterium]PHY11537.1 MAG: X-Pro dipeptidyl-peptidase [Acidobacterium sp.]